jgi:hypothetical protein
MNSEDGRFELPDRVDFCDELEQSRMERRIYDDYSLIVDLVNEVDEPLAFEEAYAQAEERGFSASEDPFKQRVKTLFDWNSDLLNWIVGQFPRHDTWVDVGAQHASVSSVNSETLNEVQQGCTEKGNEMRDRYAEASLREFQSRAIEDRLQENTPSDRLGEVVDVVMDEVAHLCADELPDRIESITQASKSIAGDANEEICVRCLETLGYSNGPRTDGHEFTGGGDDADIIVFSSDNQLNVEVKSAATRERASRSLMGEEQWVLFSFFDDASEVRSRMLSGNRQGSKWIKSSIAAYVPPRTLHEVEMLDDDRDDRQSAYKHQTSKR